MSEGKKEDRELRMQRDLEKIRDVIGSLIGRKDKIEALTASPAFSNAFFNCFSLGSFSDPRVAETAGDFRVSIKSWAPPEDSALFLKPSPGAEPRWRLDFSIKIKSLRTSMNPHITFWRSASVSEIITCWKDFYPLVAVVLKEDSKNIDSVERAIEHLKKSLATDIMTGFLDESSRLGNPSP